VAKDEKLDRKDIAAPDEFQVVSQQAVSWLVEHRMLLIGGVVGVLLLGIGAAVVSSQRREAVGTAAVNFRDAHKQFAAKSYAEAGTAFQRIATDSAGTPFAKLAVLYRAHALARQNDAAGAATGYTEFLATNPVDYLRQQALVGLGAAKEASGDTAGALEAYTSARALAGPLQTDAAIAVGRINESKGDAAAAQAVYVELLKDAGLDPGVRAAITSKVPADKRPAEPPAPQS
jgi:tetratricopeptide (TPR) repeat protein